MSEYIDGFVIPLPKNKLESYRKMAEVANQVWREHGALDYRECIGEDLEAKEGCGSFLAGLNVKDGETVAFSWITYKSRQHRDEVNEKVFKDPRLAEMCGGDDMPFDPQRMLYGGFQGFVPGDK
ncbi:DUF1428 domain-containing protein [Pelagicoccus sp. SDUM812005]|uniref:DUF1428 domain-containing protein n=1 Tax=Pelagicoccus sp. SDUM812005 TaxID=3041257 RepID=UPI00280C657D|nr:DUF1428 domain-containing protein [Pelagicoccus sp. SDUM812005]MDQ8181696.1 DUF1428 domain-containing protein [Pelagicoccus sp. SDUM812005]